MEPPVLISFEHSRTYSAAESLDHFGTVAFGLETMRRLIGVDHVHHRVDGVAWFATVPRSYRDAVEHIVSEVFDRHRGSKLLEREVDDFIRELNSMIWARVEPQC
jgi:hypothetical protein